MLTICRTHVSGSEASGSKTISESEIVQVIVKAVILEKAVDGKSGCLGKSIV